MLISAHSTSSQLLWNAAASSPIGVTWSWMPLRPSGSPIPGVGIMWPTLPGTIAAGWAASGGAASWAVPAAGAAAATFPAGAAAGACAAAAGVSPAAAKAIAHPISLINTPGMLGTGRAGACPGFAAPIGAGSPSLKRLIRRKSAQVLKGSPTQPNGRSRCR